MEDKIARRWRKSSYSGNGGGNCVEVSESASMVLVRDTKDCDGAVLTVSADVWGRFTASVKRNCPHSLGTWNPLARQRSNCRMRGGSIVSGGTVAGHLHSDQRGQVPVPL